MTRLEIATQIAAAIVSSIRDEATYGRLRGLAAQQGNGTVSLWIAEEAFKQADALLTVDKRLG